MGLFSTFFKYLPISSRKIVFANFNGKGYGDNPKYIAEEILRQELKYDLVWLVDNSYSFYKKGIRCVSIHSRKGRFELSTAKVIINNVKNSLPYEKKSGQYYIQTWHGDLPLKYIEGEVEDRLSPEYISQTKEDSKRIDLLLSGSRFMSDIYQQAFWYKGEILEAGLPRNDIFFRSTPGIVRHVKLLFNIPDTTRIALYAPTFRDDKWRFEFPHFQTIISCLEQKTDNKWVVIIRLHPNDLSRTAEINYSEQVINGTFYPDQQEIEKAADLLITDYSSMMLDFMLQKKPVVLYSTDLDHFEQARGLRSIYYDLPLPICQNEVELKDALLSFQDNAYRESVTTFLNHRIGSFDSGIASKTVVEHIRTIVDGPSRSQA